MKAIVVKYIGATNTRPSRLKATAEGVPSITRGYDYASDDHGKRRIAQDLCDKYKWKGELIEGGLPNGDTVFVFAS